MYEFHGWFGLAESTEESDVGGLDAAVDELRSRLGELNWQTTVADLSILNGQYYLTLTGLINRRRDEAVDVDEILQFIATRLVGSWGLLYERSHDIPVPPGSGAFRVRVLTRGSIRQHLDPFLSPVNPNIED